ncbi:MAG: hypothetical protein RLZZ15_4002 [Verrucomicrobiota bacterium]|jgi:hypothetical protein
MSTATVKELRHEFPRIYAAARRAPVKITKQGKVIGTFDATAVPTADWTPPDFTARSRSILGPKKRAIDIVKLWAGQASR